MDAFQGDLNPLSGRAIFETCVVPTLLYGRESWILTEDMIYFGEFSRRSWKVSGSSNSRFHSALAVHVLLTMAICANQSCYEEVDLKRIVSGDEVVSSRVQNTGGGGCQQDPTCPGGKLSKQTSHQSRILQSQ